MHFDNDLWLPVSGENTMGDSMDRKGHAYRNSRTQTGQTDQYWSKWLSLEV